MEGYTRYALYYAPPPGPLAEFGAAWLGWDPETGQEVAHPAVAGLPRAVEAITATPRKYGFHGTLKPPFRLAEGIGIADLHAATEALTAQLPPVRLEGLRLARLGSFVALVPQGRSEGLEALATTLVESLDGFRAPPDARELARRRASGLSARQNALLERWGYPYVMEEFRFHLTLSGALPEAEAEAVVAALGPVLAPRVPQPFRIHEVCLFGEGQDGRFHNLHRYALTG